jgi:predicted HicB family RNase H-like nuclease
MKMLTYKGYQGRCEYDHDADLFHGDVMHLADVITFQGCTLDELKGALADSVEDYLAFCALKGRTPEAPPQAGSADAC